MYLHKLTAGTTKFIRKFYITHIHKYIYTYIHKQTAGTSRFIRKFYMIYTVFLKGKMRQCQPNFSYKGQTQKKGTYTQIGLK